MFYGRQLFKSHKPQRDYISSIFEEKSILYRTIWFQSSSNVKYVSELTELGSSNLLLVRF